MRICIITKYLPPAKTDGIPRNRWEYARHFAKLGHEVHIITSGENGVEETRNGIYIHHIPAFDETVYNRYFRDIHIMEHVRRLLTYSYLVYERIKELNEKIGLDIIDAPLWDIEGYLTKLFLPGIPMALRLESTTMLIKEIRTGVTPAKDDHNNLETHFLEIADSYVFDSWSIFKETERLYQVDLSKKPSAMVYHGIELEPYAPLPPAVEKKRGDAFRVIIVGRMEKRKGTDIIVKTILPVALKEIPKIEFHFIGFDNAQWDGFKEETGMFYTEYVKKHFSEYLDKQIFIHGYVKDDVLADQYNRADCVLGLSRYESFGLLYVEAMQKGKPLIVFGTGAVPELFENEVDALVIPLEQPVKVVDALKKINDDPAFAHRMVGKAHEKLYARFHAERMGKECSAFFESVVKAYQGQKVYQVMNALSDKDGVSNITIDYDKFLRSEGILTQVLGTWATKPVEQYQQPIESVTFHNADMILYHYWNYCDRAEYFNKLEKGRKVFLFHNMTSPSFFEKGDEAFETTSKGFQQLKDMDNFDLYVGFSDYSVKIMEQSISTPIETFVLPPLIDPRIILERPFDPAVVESVRQRSSFNILFVGRIANSKRQDDLARFFAYYVSEVNPDTHLILVGGGHDKFVRQLAEKIKELGLAGKVTLTGKVSDNELYSYYRASDIYISMSEHEGFGIPLVEAMTFGIPVLAYNCTSIPDTVGDNGGLFSQKDNKEIAVLVEKVRTDSAFREEMIRKQNIQLKKYSAENVKKAFTEMEELLDEQFKKRGARRKDEFLSEYNIPFNDPDIVREGKCDYRDDGFICLESSGVTKSRIIIDAEFESFELNLLMHEWGGKGTIQVDDIYTEEFDLYSSQWKIETFTSATKLPFGPHRIIIEALSERNIDSKGSEILFKNITLFGPSRPRIIKNLNPKTPLARPVVAEKLKPVNARPNRSSKGVWLTDVKKATEPIFTYTGEWSVKDGMFKYAVGNKGLNQCSFELSFTELELAFMVHAWCGIVKVTVDDTYTEVINLFSEQHGARQVRLSHIFDEKPHKVVITPINDKHKNAHDYQVFLKEVSTHHYIPVDIDDETLAQDYKISINVNTMNRGPYLEALLKALVFQTYPHFEVVIVNGPSTDNTEEILNRYKDRIKITHCPDANLTRSRNIGIKNSAGNYVAYIDDDAIPCDEYWLENYVYYLVYRKDQQIGAIGGPVKHRDTDFFEYNNGVSSDYAVQVFDVTYLNGRTVDGNRWFYRVCGCNNIMSRKALYDIGGFDERMYHYLDETDVCLQMWRHGYKVDNHPLNYVRHYKATNEYRKSDYDIRWDVISRSDTFFCIRNGDDFILFRILKLYALFKKKHFYKEIYDLLEKKKIDKAAFKRYKKMIWSGFWTGMKWGLSQKTKKNYLTEQNNDFKYFNDQALLKEEKKNLKQAIGHLQ
ncbi:MAG: glycosyltransferase [Bacteroidetes bacterium]|nr:glycosyltransferase [Bacteroidota bacterium]